MKKAQKFYQDWVCVGTNNPDATYKVQMYYLKKDGNKQNLGHMTGLSALGLCFLSYKPCPYTGYIRGQVLACAKEKGYG
ncbi:MAG: hypothetical protein V3T17_18370 [Pseudomonadales bacterium]